MHARTLRGRDGNCRQCVDFRPVASDDECGCLSDHSRITFAVFSCTGYTDRRQASLREMEDIAWVLKSDPRRNQIGFVPARRLKPEDRYVLPDEWD